MYSIQPKSHRSVKDLAIALGGPQYTEFVEEVEFNDSGTKDVMILRCRTRECPPPVAEEIALSGYSFETQPRAITDKMVITVAEDDE